MTAIYMKETRDNKSKHSEFLFLFYFLFHVMNLFSHMSNRKIVPKKVIMKDERP